VDSVGINVVAEATTAIGAEENGVETAAETAIVHANRL
jgi:hypothetical protein